MSEEINVSDEVKQFSELAVTEWNQKRIALELAKLLTQRDEEIAELRKALQFIARWNPASSHMQLSDAPEIARRALAAMSKDAKGNPCT